MSLRQRLMQRQSAGSGIQKVLLATSCATTKGRPDTPAAALPGDYHERRHRQSTHRRHGDPGGGRRSCGHFSSKLG